MPIPKLLMVATAVAAGGKVLSGIAANTQARFQAKVFEADAKARLDQAEADEEHKRRISLAETENDRLGLITQGAPLEQLGQAVAERELAARFIEFQGQSDARSLRLRAKAARTRGRNQLIGSVIGSGSTILTGASHANALKTAGSANSFVPQSSIFSSPTAPQSLTANPFDPNFLGGFR